MHCFCHGCNGYEGLHDLKIFLSSKSIEAMFSLLDQNGDGVIDMEEFLTLMQVRRYCTTVDVSLRAPPSSHP